MDNGKVLIALCGKKQVGKSTSFRFIGEILSHNTVKRFSFAEKLKTLTAEMFGVDYEFLIGSDEQKDSSTHLDWDDVDMHIKTSFGYYTANCGSKITHRELLQIVGTNLFRAVRPGIWPEFLQRTMMECDDDIIVVDDARFPNEVELLRNMGGHLVKIYRDTGSTNAAGHSSETALDHLDDDYYDYVITDDGNRTMTDLYSSWVKIISNICG